GPVCVSGKHDWDRLGALPGGLHLGRRHREDDVDIHAEELRYQPGQLIGRFRPPELDGNVLAFDIAELAQAGAQRLDPVRISRCRTMSQEADVRDFCVLRTRYERPRSRRAAEECDELAAPHSITSSASESRLSEILMPSALAVLRLITVSNLVGCRTGRSAGFAPLRIFAV